MSPARSRRSASHAAGTHGWLPQKTGRPGLRRGGVGGYNLRSVPPNSPPDCGTPTTSRLYPFGAAIPLHIIYSPEVLMMRIGEEFLTRCPSWDAVSNIYSPKYYILAGTQPIQMYKSVCTIATQNSHINLRPKPPFTSQCKHDDS